MTKTVQDVKLSIPMLVDKLTGTNPQPFTDEDVSTLIFAFESNVLFDTVAQKFVSSLRSLPVVPEILSREEGMTDEEYQAKLDERESALKGRSEVLRTILTACLKDSILRELSIRFGS